MIKEGKKWENLLSGLVAGLGALTTGAIQKNVKSKIEDIYNTSINKLQELINPQPTEPQTITIPANKTDIDREVVIPNPNYVEPQPASFDKILTTYLDMQGRLAKYGEMATPYMNLLNTFMNTQLAMEAQKQKQKEKNVWITSDGAVYVYDKYGNVQQVKEKDLPQGTYKTIDEGMKFFTQPDENGQQKYFVSVPFVNTTYPDKIFYQTIEIDENSYKNQTLTEEEKQNLILNRQLTLKKSKGQGRGRNTGGYNLQNNNNQTETETGTGEENKPGLFDAIFSTPIIETEVNNLISLYNSNKINANQFINRVNDVLKKHNATQEYIDKIIKKKIRDNTNIELE